MTNQKDPQNDRHQQGSGNPGDTQKSSDAGKKGGQPSQGGQHQADSTGTTGQRGGAANPNDPNRSADPSQRDKASQQK